MTFGRALRNPTFQVLSAIACGAAVGALFPSLGRSLRPLGEGFVGLIKMTIAPIVFLTVVLGIGGAGSLRKVGRVGGKALLYFEVVTTFALFIGLVAGNLIHPGSGIDTRSAAGAESIASYAAASRQLDATSFLSHLVPSNIVDSFARGDILQVLVFSVLFGVAATSLGERARPVLAGCEHLSRILFRLLAMVMKLAPLGAFGGMAFTVGSYGIGTLLPLGKLLIALYLTMGLFVFGALGLVCRLWGFRISALVIYLWQEILIVLGTSSSESVLPRVMDKLERYGCGRAVVGLVVPTGYSFNLDGTAIYLSMAVLFLAQAFHVELSPGRQLALVAILMVTSKGAAAVTGGGFVVLASTLTAFQVIPVEGLALLLGVDRFLSEARAIVNLIGNAVATVVIAKSEGEFHPPVASLSAESVAEGGQS